MYGNYDNNQYGRPDFSYVSQAKELLVQTNTLVRAIADLQKRMTNAYNSIWNGQSREADPERVLNDIVEAGDELDKIMSALQILKVENKGPADVITVDMVRNVFYNTIPEAIDQAVKELVIEKREYFEDEDGQLYQSAAALTLVSVVLNSKDCKDGIRLMNNKIVTVDNCPGDYAALMKGLMAIKEPICKMKPEEFKTLKKYLLNPNIPREKVPGPLLNLIGGIESIGVGVTELENFKKVAKGALFAVKTMV